MLSKRYESTEVDRRKSFLSKMVLRRENSILYDKIYFCRQKGFLSGHNLILFEKDVHKRNLCQQKWFFVRTEFNSVSQTKFLSTKVTFC